MPPPAWLPDLVPFANPWEDYCDTLYAHFTADFVAAKPAFRGRPINVMFEPRLNGKAFTFWHLISEKDANGDDRLPNFRRCERIRWARALLVAPEAERRVWGEVSRGPQPSLGVSLLDFSYVLFLRAWPTSYQLLTAYAVDDANRQLKYRREWEQQPL